MNLQRERESLSRVLQTWVLRHRASLENVSIPDLTDHHRKQLNKLTMQVRTPKERMDEGTPGIRDGQPSGLMKQTEGLVQTRESESMKDPMSKKYWKYCIGWEAELKYEQTTYHLLTESAVILQENLNTSRPQGGWVGIKVEIKPHGIVSNHLAPYGWTIIYCRDLSLSSYPSHSHTTVNWDGTFFKMVNEWNLIYSFAVVK